MTIVATLGLLAAACDPAGTLEALSVTGEATQTGTSGAAPTARPDDTPAPPPGPTPGSTPVPTPGETDEAEPVPMDPPTTTPVVGEGDPATWDEAPGPAPDVPLEPGDHGAEVLELQERLRDLGYWTGEPDGVYGDLTTQAVYAFQGVEGLPRDGVATPEVLETLDGATRPEPQSGPGDRLEIALDEQVLRVVRGGEVVWAFHTSTGTEEPYRHPDGGTRIAETPRGDWAIGWRVDGWRESSLGRLYRPVYFHENGIAVHGYADVPPQPASHGCARVTLEAMDFLWEESLVDEGQPVLVY